MTLSLRARLLIGVIALTVVGLVVSDVATFTALQSFLVGRIDTQLAAGHAEATRAVGGPGGGGSHQGSTFPVGTVVERVKPDGTVVGYSVTYPNGSEPSDARPVLPKSLPDAGEENPSSPYTVRGTYEVSQFRVTDWREGFFQGDFVVLAIPMTEVQATLSQLLLLEAIVTLAVVAATAMLAWFLIHFGLRPLRRMGAVAGEIAAGDYSRRVEPATSNTEIGRLGLALNAMLAQIESEA